MDFSSILFVALVVCAYIIRSALSSQKNKKPGGKTTTGSAAAENARARAAQSAARRNQAAGARKARKSGLPVADDGHVIRREDDISCRRFGLNCRLREVSLTALYRYRGLWICITWEAREKALIISIISSPILAPSMKRIPLSVSNSRRTRKSQRFQRIVPPIRFLRAWSGES